MEKAFYLADSHEQAANEAARVYDLMDEKIVSIKKTKKGGIISARPGVGKFVYEILNFKVMLGNIELYSTSDELVAGGDLNSLKRQNPSVSHLYTIKQTTK